MLEEYPRQIEAEFVFLLLDLNHVGEVLRGRVGLRIIVDPFGHLIRQYLELAP